MLRFWRSGTSLGERGERLAARTLRRNGYSILERNAHLGRYEIDIIAREEDTVVFVEVKTRRADDVVQPEENVGHEKQRHIIRASEVYRARLVEDETYYRFDVVSVVMPELGKPRVTIFRDAFQEA